MRWVSALLKELRGGFNGAGEHCPGVWECLSWLGEAREAAGAAEGVPPRAGCRVQGSCC